MKIAHFGSLDDIVPFTRLTVAELVKGFSVRSFSPIELGEKNLNRGGLSGNQFFRFRVGADSFFAKSGEANNSSPSVTNDVRGALLFFHLFGAFHPRVLSPCLLANEDNIWHVVFPHLPDHHTFPSVTGWDPGEPTKVLAALHEVFYDLDYSSSRKANGTNQKTLIHGDVTPSNVVFVNGEVHFIDIAHLGFGNHEHEIAMFLSYVLHYANLIELEKSEKSKQLRSEIISLISKEIAEPLDIVKQVLAGAEDWAKVSGDRIQIRKDFVNQMEVLGDLISRCLSRSGMLHK
jgi:hypothetical protein